MKLTLIIKGWAFFLCGWGLFLIILFAVMIYFYLKGNPNEPDETSHIGRFRHSNDEDVIF